MTTTFDGTALALDDVVKTFGSTTAVNHLSMTANRGEVLALLGPNGAGKTTTIEMCEGFTRPTSGRIRVLGLDPVHQADEIRERIGIMLQGGGSYSGIRVSEMLRLAASYNADPHDPDWLIELLGLSGVRNTTYRRLSGGQQQRLSLALALIGRPELVFLDEPTAGMDVQSRDLVWELVRALKRDGVTVILTTHFMDEAESLADQVVIVDHGQVVAQGSPAELTASDASLLTFSTDRPLSAEALADHQLDQLGELTYRACTPVSPRLVADLTETAARHDVLIRSFDVNHRNLEDVFLELTGRELRS